MATQDDIKELKGLIDDLVKAGNVGTRRYKDKDLTLEQLLRAYDSLVPDEKAPWYSRAISAVTEAVGEAVGPLFKTGKIQDLEASLKLRRDQILALTQDSIPGRNSAWIREQRKLFENNPSKLVELRDKAQEALLRLDPTNELVAREAIGSYAERTTTATGEEAVAMRVAEAISGRVAAEQSLNAAELARTYPAGTGPKPTVPKGSSAPGAKGGQRAVAPAEWIDTQLELRDLQNTPENRKKMQALYKKQGPTTWNDQMQQDFVARYPQYAYLFDAEVFGDSADLVKNIIVRAVNEDWFLYPETAKTMIKRMVAATPYGMRSTDSQESFDSMGLAEQNAKVDAKVRELKGLYGNLGLADDVWTGLGRTAARNSLDDAGTRANLFKTIYETTPEGAMRYQNAVKVLETGKLGQDVRKLYRDYMFNASDANVSADIQAYTTGVKSLDDIRRERQVLAKGAFPALMEMIDQGLTPKQVADQYAAYASDILELPVQSIDMTTSLYRKAFEGPKLMSIGDWQKMLRSDPNYGWQYTSTANKQAMDIATSIARAFGAVK